MRKVDTIFAGQRQVLAASLVAAGGRIVAHETIGWAIPGEVSRRAIAADEVALAQKPTRVGAHQQWSVAPIADKGAVVPSSLNQQICQAEGQRAVAARTNAQPHIG